MKRIIYFGTRVMLLAVLALGLATFVVACHGSDEASEAEVGTGDDGTVEEEVGQITLLGQVADGSRGILISFPEDLPEASVSKADDVDVEIDLEGLTQEEVEASIAIRNAAGQAVGINRMNWLDAKTLRLSAAFHSCGVYSV